LKVAGEDDFVKVLDFGISKIRASNTKITKVSALIGTPDYMSPEQAMGAGDDVDERTDQWALACIAWECVSGRAPFVADTGPAMLFQVVHRELPSLAEKVADLPDGVEAVLRRALAKNKNERFPNVVEFAQAPDAAVGARSVPVQIPAEATAEVAPAESGPHATPPDRTERPATTFSHAAGEAKAPEPGPRRPIWHWAVAGAGAVALIRAVVVVLRPARTGQQAASAVPAAKAPPAIAPPPAAAPKPAVVAAPAPAAEPAVLPPLAAPPPALPAKAAEPASRAAVPEAPAEPAPAKAGVDETVDEGKSNTAPAEAKPHVRRATSRSKAKSQSPERRLIKEL
jgi:hypothetical protein